MVVQNLNEGKGREVGEDLNSVDLRGGMIVIEVRPLPRMYRKEIAE
jgi:hypothetical protein